MPEFHMCDVCSLNRATLHLDETVEGTLLATAHLCDDCWYRLGIRVPLGNLWNHIQRAKQNLPPLPDPASTPREELFEEVKDEDDDLDLLDTSPLAVAEPDDLQDNDPDQDVQDAFKIEDDRPSRDRDILDIESLLEEVNSESDLPEAGKKLGMDAVRVENIHPSLISIFAWDLLVRCRAIPVSLEGNRLTVAMADPFDKIAVANIEVFVERNGFTFLQAFADEEAILRELERHRDPPSSRFESLS